ncbi:hypothetical protein [Azospirillum canadense]|uniref:hypothetical protein n=1 Tax=Azospirillum canadense TaxID=403962 RepID=UPI002226EBA6|nr:hypothetical protein [Azospirillum canadense]MCW2243755.1 hypothetical protein [Azospirillum canadense]
MTDTVSIGPVEIPIVQDSEGSFHIQVAMPNGGKPLTVQLDTGSNGLVVPASFFYVDGVYVYNEATNTIVGNLLPGVTLGGPAVVKYQPSADDIHGFHYTVTDLSVGLKDNEAVATAPTISMIGAVIKTPHMCGIGFGRPVLGDNPFLAIKGMATGELYPSYLLTTKGIWLGCTPAQAATQLGASAFGFQKLTYLGKGNAPKNSSQWSTPTGHFRVSNINPTDTTKYEILVDTGLDLSMVKMPVPDYETRITAGSIVAVELPVEPATVSVVYSYGITGTTRIELAGVETTVFTTESLAQDAVPPQYLLPRGEGHFVNTGFHLLNSYQLYFDASVGQVGFAAYPAHPA